VERGTGSRHPGLAIVAGINAAAAWFGAAGLITGFLGLGKAIEARLPFASPVLGGLALATLVAVPLTLLAAAAWIGDPRTPEATVAAGVVLIGWIAVQALFLRTFSAFQPTYALLGVALIAWGRHVRRAAQPAVGRADPR
jgi:hypothetical protein